jgi:putative transposase
MEIISKWLTGILRQRNSLMMENLALRHQLMVLKRNRPKPRFTEPDRLFWVAYSKLVKGWQGFLEIASPRTVVDWNKRRFKRYWANISRNRRLGRPCVSQEIQDLIHTMSQANPRWGTPRIIGELKKLGISVSKATVDRYRIKRKGSPSPTWKAFLTNEAKAMASIDFFTVPTATFLCSMSLLS